MAYLPPPEEYAACSKGLYDYMKMEMASCFEPDLMGVWVLTQISHWDHEWERVVILSEDALSLVEYDFHERKVRKLWQTIRFDQVTDISIGTLCYPEFTISPRRCNLGIKLNWGHRCCPEPKHYWNPASMCVPYVVLMSHPLSLYKRLPHEVKQKNFSIFDFAWPFLRLIKASGLYQIPVANMPICIETYLGLGSVLYNAHEWGYDKKRRGYVGMFKCDMLIPESDPKLDEGDEYVDDGGEGEEKVADRSFHCSRDDTWAHRRLLGEYVTTVVRMRAAEAVMPTFKQATFPVRQTNNREEVEAKTSYIALGSSVLRAQINHEIATTQYRRINA